jgi:Spx/MgsR family transcriptional regulator
MSGDPRIRLYGIRTCDTVKKARKWLDERGVAYRFHDFKTQGLDEGRLRGWVREIGWEAMLNKRGTTWRKLPQAVREAIEEESAVRIMLQTPSIIRRPVLDTGTARHVGFSPTLYEEIFR